MFLPFGDEPNAPQTPVATYGLIALNAFVWLVVCAPLVAQPAQAYDQSLGPYLHSIGLDAWQGRMVPHVSAYDVWLFEHAFSPARFSVAALFLSLFLHAGWLHLLGNMLFLYIFGDNVEAYLGRVRYIAVYLATGAMGTLCYTAFRWDSQTPIIGASGAISGVLGCYFVWFPHNRVRVFMFLFLFMDVILVPARVVLGFYLVFENILPLLMHAATTGGVAYGAHLGGFVAGAGFAELWRRQLIASGRGPNRLQGVWDKFRRDEKRRTNAPSRHVMQPPELLQELPPPLVHPLVDMVQQARWSQAAALEASMLRVERARQTPETLFLLADGLTQEKHYAAALALLQRLMGQFAAAQQREFLARAHLRAGLLLWRGMQRRAGAREHLQAAAQDATDPRIHQAAHLALGEIDAVAD